MTWTLKDIRNTRLSFILSPRLYLRWTMFKSGKGKFYLLCRPDLTNSYTLLKRTGWRSNGLANHLRCYLTRLGIFAFFSGAGLDFFDPSIIWIYLDKEIPVSPSWLHLIHTHTHTHTLMISIWNLEFENSA